MCDLQVELYNHIVEEGTDGEAAAKKAYIEAREEIDHDAEKKVGDKVSSALIKRVRITFVDFDSYWTCASALLYSIFPSLKDSRVFVWS